MSRSYQRSGFGPVCSSRGDKFCRTYFHKSDRRKTRQLLKQITIPEEVELDCQLCMDCNFWLESTADIPYSDYMDEEYWPDFNECHNHKCFEIGDFPEDKIITSDYDRSLKFSEKWSWASDGGSYWTDDLASIRKDFDKEVFGISPRNQKTIWEEYLKLRKTYDNTPGTKKWKVRLTYETGRRHRDFFGGTWITETYYKFLELPYHKGYIEIPDEFEGYVDYKFWRQKDYSRKQPHSDWFLMDFLLSRNLVPKTFTEPEELINWLRKNQEVIIRKWFKIRFRK